MADLSYENVKLRELLEVASHGSEYTGGMNTNAWISQQLNELERRRGLNKACK